MEQKPIRVTFIVNDFLIGGMQRQLVEQLRFYDRAAFDISLITLLAFPHSPTLFSELPADLPVYQLSFRSIIDSASWKKLRTLLKDLSPDVVVSSLYFANCIARILQPRFKYVSIAREHNTYIHKPWWQQRVDRFLASRSYRIVAVSKRVASFTAAQEHVPATHFQVIPNGINTAKAKEYGVTLPPKGELQKEMGIEPGTLVLLNVARLIPQKNHELLLEGFALFLHTRPSTMLLIAGDGPSRESLEKKALALGIQEAVLFLGYQEDTGRLYHAADIYVSTSEIEGFSNSYLEALSYGLPLVVTSTGGTDELLEEGINGVCITDETPSGVSDALVKLTTGDISRYAEAAQRTAEKFDIRVTVHQYEQLFTKAVMASRT